MSRIRATKTCVSIPILVQSEHFAADFRIGMQLFIEFPPQGTNKIPIAVFHATTRRDPIGSCSRPRPHDQNQPTILIERDGPNRLIGSHDA